MRWSVLVGLVVAGVALAAPGKAKGVGSLSEDDPDPVKPASFTPATNEADLALLRALLWAIAAAS